MASGSPDSPSQTTMQASLTPRFFSSVSTCSSRPTAQRSDLAGWAGYGYCASHSRFFWGLRLHLICTPSGLPITWALASPKVDERQVLTAVLDDDPGLLADRPGLLIIADKTSDGRNRQAATAALAGIGKAVVSR